MKAKDQKLPKHVQDSFHSVEAAATLYSKNGEVFSEYLDKESRHSSLIEAYDFFNGYGVPMDFSKTLEELPGISVLDAGMVSVKAEGESYSRLLLSVLHETLWTMLAEAYAFFLKVDKAWRKDKNNELLAAEWINHHPIFWTAYNKESRSWETDNGLSKIFARVNSSKEKVMMEAGPAYFDDDLGYYSQVCHDYRLDVSAKSFGQCHTKLAKRVDKFYAPDGSKRPKEEKMKKIKKEKSSVKTSKKRVLKELHSDR